MTHPKMRYTYVGVDSHKDTHTAVFMDCFFEKLGELKCGNLSSDFERFFEKSLLLQQPGTTLFFGMEDTSNYGRALTVFLKEKGQAIKHVNAFLVAGERKKQTVTQKTDSIDALCAARVLLSNLGELPNAETDDRLWILRTMVTRREFLVKGNSAVKNHLHTLVMHHYPNFRELFPTIDSDTSLAFLKYYPSPSALENTSLMDLTCFFKDVSKGKIGEVKARKVLDTLQNTTVIFQEIRDEAVRSAVERIEANNAEIGKLEADLEVFLDQFNCTLTSMNGIDTVCAAQILSQIGDIRRFPTPAKLARYAGIAPVEYSSGKKEKKHSNQRGNRELNTLFHMLAVRMVASLGRSGQMMNPFFYEYHRRKISEGKTKRQALKCVQRRLVNIIWTMLTNNEDYVNPPMFDLGKEEK